LRLLVTGGAGFIGSNYVRRRLRERPADRIVVLDKLTYAGRRENLEGCDPARLEFVRGDVALAEDVERAIGGGADAIVHFAAETHVDRSIDDPGAFVRTDVLGAYVLLEAARARKIRALMVSTDEVYGSRETGAFREDDRLDPSSPYSASKAGADLLALAYAKTFGADVVVTRCSNNYGPYQYPEKFIPLAITNLLEGGEIPLYGDGRQRRDWIHVDDHGRALDLLLERGRAGEVYNIGADEERENIEVARRLCRLCGAGEDRIKPVRDRPAHDRRYAVDASKVRALGWAPAVPFDEGLASTVAWYKARRDWWGPIKSGEFREYYRKHYNGRPPARRRTRSVRRARVGVRKMSATRMSRHLSLRGFDRDVEPYANR
jgi:dTDP-glucose 4,6-dehydratase